MKLSDWKIALGIFTSAFGLGWGASERVMLKAGQDKVAHGTYVLRDDLKNGYVERVAYDKAVADLNATNSKLGGVEAERKELESQVASLKAKQSHRSELENELAMLKYQLEQKRKTLGMATEIEGVIQSAGYGDVPRNTEALPQIKHEISVIEARIAEIDKFMMEN